MENIRGMHTATATCVILLMSLSLAHAADLQFCRNYLKFSRPTCPRLTSLPAVDLSKFKGTWYQVGATARYKVRSEFGAACLTSNFHSQRGKAIRVTNRGVTSVGPARYAQAAILAQSARFIARQITLICSSLTTLNRTANAPSDAQLFNARLALGRIALPASKASATSAALNSIDGQMTAISNEASRIYRQVTSLSQQAGILSLQNRLANLTAVQQALTRSADAIQKATSAASLARSRIYQGAVRARNNIVNVTVSAADAKDKALLVRSLTFLSWQASVVGSMAWAAAKTASTAAAISPVAATLFPAPFLLPVPTFGFGQYRQNYNRVSSSVQYQPCNASTDGSLPPSLNTSYHSNT